ncbi:PQQ-binding-like beta-propeller repeat protein [Streptomyces kaniharaensis]|uniref:PQQ-binding-like beta-propeller repeat protein n=1 Tax=Streptomyces kaniharaensis TaxID=212423 RepID=A0A6N7KWH8_9ACTN|nr:serine/threonine-protein kinase [Streptomyces kaniharaensis]MQS16012.1 PQQ-binding-like beta-propeller repeat protein [Streptomyces kaniharaensis]
MAASGDTKGMKAQPAVFVGPHQLLRPLGEGGMGVVYLARSPGLRLLAVKVIRPEYAEEPQFQDRFRQEVEAARRVTGFHTPPVVDAQPRGPRPWMATSYLPAPSLGEVVRRFGPLGEAGVRALGAALAEALAAIHAVGVVHRDLKPGNVLIARDGPRVIDFGISRAFDAVHLTRTGMVCGTPGYIAPERIVSASVTYASSDIFSLGCLLVYALNGRTPFGTGEPAQVNRRVVYEWPDLSGVPAVLGPLVAACLDKDPARRPTAAAVLAALAPADPAALLSPGLLADIEARERQAGIDLAAPPADPPALPVRMWQSLSRRALFGLGTGLGAGVAAAVGVPLLLTRRARATAGTATVGKPVDAWGADAAGASPLPDAPAPLWSQPFSGVTVGHQLSVLGSTPVLWTEGLGATGLDGLTGRRAWSQQQVQFFQAQNGLLYGTSLDFKSLVWLNAAAEDHRIPLTVPAEQQMYAAMSMRVFGADDRTVVMARQTSATGGGVVVGADLGSGEVLWQHEVAQDMAVSMARHMESEFSGSGSSMGLVADGRCYYRDGDVLHAVDLRTGAAQWQAAGLGNASTPSRLMRTGELLVVVSGQTAVALEPATGRQRWTAPPAPQVVFGCALGSGRLVLSGALGTAYCLDVTTGKGLWHSTVAAVTEPGAAGDFRAPSAGDGFFAVPLSPGPFGAAVLDAANGAVRWVARPASDEGRWTTAADGKTLYCASATTLRAFRAGGA